MNTQVSPFAKELLAILSQTKPAVYQLAVDLKLLTNGLLVPGMSQLTCFAGFGKRSLSS